MLHVLFLAETIDHTKEYEHLLPVAIALVAIAMLYAAIATWRVTSAGGPSDH